MAEDFSLFSLSDTAFTRRRKLPIEHIVGSLLHKSTSQSHFGYQLLCADYFYSIEKSKTVMTIARSSFSEARDNLSWQAFEYLLSKVQLKHDSRWKGHRIRSVDGTKVLLPRSKDVLKHYPIWRSHFGVPHYPQALLVVASDLMTGQPIWAELGNKHISERDALVQCISTFEVGDVAVLDRGFQGHRVMEAFHERKQHFVVRLKSRGMGVSKLIDPKRKDHTQTIELSSGESMNVRVIRGQRFGSGRHLYLATNLVDENTYSRKEILELYRKREAIEEMFRHAKASLKLSNIRSKKVNGILQEIFATLASVAIVMGARYRYEQHLQKKQNIHNKRISYRAIAWYMSRLGDLAEVLVLELLRFTHHKQPGRQYPRYSRTPPSKWSQVKRTSACRLRKTMKTA